MVDPDGQRLEVDVAVAQCKQLALPQARERREHDEVADALGFRAAVDYLVGGV